MLARGMHVTAAVGFKLAWYSSPRRREREEREREREREHIQAQLETVIIAQAAAQRKVPEHPKDHWVPRAEDVLLITIGWRPPPGRERVVSAEGAQLWRAAPRRSPPIHVANCRGSVSIASQSH